MGPLIIDGQSYTILNISANIVDENLVLNIETANRETFQYIIYEDIRCPDIKQTNKFIQNRINDTLNGKPFMLREDIQRSYIHIKDANTGNEQQYTAHKS